MSDNYPIGTTIPLRPALVVDTGRQPITGSTTLTVEIERDSDGYFWDWNDSSFKNAGWTTKAGALTEVSAGNAPGWYKKTSGWNTTSQSAGWYWITYRDTAGAAANFPQVEELSLGGVAAGVVDIQARLPAALVGGKIDASVGALGTGAITAATFAAGAIDAAAIATNAIDADALAADAVAEIQSGLATAAAVAAVQADTDNLQTRIPAALIGGRLDVTVGAMQADVVTAAAIATDAIDADALAASAVAEIQSGLATGTNVTDARDAVLAKLPAALVGGRIDASVGAMGADTLTASALAADAVAEIQNGLATPTNITAGVITTVTNLTNAPTNGDLTATMKASVTAAVPTAVAISDVVRAGVITDHGAGSYVAPSVAGLALETTLTAIKGATFDTATDSLEALRNRGDAAWITATGFATPTNVTDARDHIEAFGQANWTTATGFAVPGSTMAIIDEALLPTKIGAGFVAAMQAGLALEATPTAIKGATFDTATDSLEALRNRGDAAWITATGFAVPGSAMTLAAGAIVAATFAVDAISAAALSAAAVTKITTGLALEATLAAVPAGVWAYTISGNATLTQAGGALYGLKVMSFNRMEEAAGNPGTLLVYADDGVTLRFSFTLRDATGGAVTASAGEPARRSAVA